MVGACGGAEVGRLRVPDAVRHSSCRSAEPGPSRTLMAGLGPAIHLLLEKCLRRWMDARVKPAHDEVLFCYGPGSAAHRFAKSCALRCVRGTVPLNATLPNRTPP